MQSTHFNIKPIQCYINEKYLYDMDESKTGMLPCKLISVSSYKGHVVTFNVLIEDRYLFSYIPANAFGLNKLSIEECSYHNCPSNEASVVYFDFDECFVYGKDKKLIGKGNYQFTIDWHNDNEMLHFIMINNIFMFVPNHKLSFKEAKLPDFKKLKQEFKI